MASTMGAWLGCSCRSKKDDDEKCAVGLTDNKDRACTDVLWFLLFLAVTGVTWTIWWTNLGEDPNKLTKATDYMGDTCEKLAYWPDLDPLGDAKTAPTWNFKVCTPTCDITSIVVDIETKMEIRGVLGGCAATGNCYPSKPIWGLCVPDTKMSSEDMEEGTSKVANAMGELQTALPLIGASVGIAILFAFFFSFMMQCMAGILVWGSILATAVGAAFCGWTLLERAKELGEESDALQDNKQANEYVGYFLLAITAIFLLIVCCMQKRIRIAIEVVKSAGRAVRDMPLTLIWPVFPMIISVAFLFLWVAMTFYFMASGNLVDRDTPKSILALTEFEDVTTYKQYEWDENTQRVFALHFFWLLWMLQFFSYFAYLVVGGAICEWYFTERDESGKKKRGDDDLELSRHPICGAMWRTLRYNLGTIALGSLIIAIIQFIRWTVRYLEAKSAGEAGKCAYVKKAVFCCVKCMLWCLECILDRVSKNALIFTAIYGDAFCPGALASFKLVWRNLSRVAMIGMVSSYVIVLGKICVAMMTTGVIGLIMLYAEPYKTEIQSPILTLVVVFVLSYVIARFMMTTFQTAVDCVFICFLVDEENNKESGKMLADEGLIAIVGKYSEDSKELAGKWKRNEKKTDDAEGPGLDTSGVAPEV